MRKIDGRSQVLIKDDGSSLLLIHLSLTNGGRELIACVPEMTEMRGRGRHTPWQRSGDVRAVTCPFCQKTSDYQSLKSQLAARGLMR